MATVGTINHNFFFDLQVTLMILTKFQVNWLFGLGEKIIFKMAAILDFRL